MNHDGNIECYSDFRCFYCYTKYKFVDNFVSNCFKQIHRKKRKATPKFTMDYRISNVANFGKGFVGNASSVRGIIIER